MRRLILPLLLWPLLGAAEPVYKIVGPDGQVTYTDEPEQGAQRIEVPGVPSYPSPALPPSSAPSTREPPDPAIRSYRRVRIVQPPHEQAMWNDLGRVEVVVEVDPPLAPGHHIAVTLDGRLAASGRGGSFFIDGVLRGEHTLIASVVGKDGEVLRRSDPLTFYLLKHSIAR